MKKTVILLVALLLVCNLTNAEKKYGISSPDGRLTAEITVGKQLSWSLAHDGEQLMGPSPVSITLDGGEQLGPDARLRQTRRKRIDQTVPSPFWISSQVRD